MKLEASMTRALLHALDPVRWASDVLGFVPDSWQSEMMRTPAKRVLLNCSRQSGKSTSTAALAAHTALYQPGALVLMVSRAQRQSAELFRKAAGFLKVARVPMPSENSTSCQLSNGSRIHALPGDRSDSLRGFSAPSLIIFDEAAFCLDEVVMACRPMLAVSDGRLMMLSTPHGMQGAFYHAWISKTEPWHRIRVTAAECPRISREFLQQERSEIGEFFYRQEYDCEFVATADQLFGEESISRAFDCPPDPLVIH